MGVITLIIAVIVLLYVPLVQDIITDIVVQQINKSSSGLTIGVSRLRLTFPLGMQVDDLMAVDERGDTIVNAGKISADVKIRALFEGELAVENVSVEHGGYCSGTPDSILYLVAKVEYLAVSDASVNLSHSAIDVGDVLIEAVDVSMALKNDTTAAAETETSSAQWLIDVNRIDMKDISCHMTMESVADSICAYIGESSLKGGRVDLSTEAPIIQLRSFTVANTSALYLSDKTLEPNDGIDFNRLSVSDVNVEIDSFYNSGTTLKAPIRKLSGVERCGLQVLVNGVYEMDSMAMLINNAEVSTLYSNIKLSGEMGLSGRTDAPLNLSVDGNVGVTDIELLYPILQPLLRDVPCNDIVVKTDINGSLAQLDVKEISVEMPNHISLAMTGELQSLDDVNKMSGKIDISGELQNADFIKTAVLEAQLFEQVNVPPMSLSGNIAMNSGVVAGKLQSVTENGRLALDAEWNSRGAEYDMVLAVDSFPVNSFLPQMGMSLLSADVMVIGSGYDVMSPKTKAKADVNLKQMIYNGKTYSNARAWASLESGNAECGIVSLNNDADFDIVANAVISENESVDWTLNGDVRHFDMRSLGLSSEQSFGTLEIDGRGNIGLSQNNISADVSLKNLEWTSPGMYINTPVVNAVAEVNDSIVKGFLKNNDLTAEFIALCPIDTLLNTIENTIAELDSQVVGRKIDVERLQRALPQFSLTLAGGSGNVINNILSSSDMSMGSLELAMVNDSLFNIHGIVEGMRMGDTRIDTVSFSALQHSKFLIYKAAIDNRPGTFDNFAHVAINGYLADDKVAAFVKQNNIEGKTGFNLGLVAAIADSTVNMKFTPYTPVIGYKDWTINKDNFVAYNFYTRHFDADVRMSNNESHLNLYTHHLENEPEHQEDVTLNISNIRLSELLSVSPYAPPVKGQLSADMSFRWDENSVSGDGTVSLDEMYYGRDRVGSFVLGVDLATTKTGVVKADASLMIDSVKTITAIGSLNDTTAVNPFNLDFSMIRFPLKVVNPFLPKNMASLSGMLNGQMDITGELSSPRFNGYVKFDSTMVKVNMIGSTFKLSDEKVPVKDNVVLFEDYTITGANDNPLTITGIVDMRDFISPRLDLAFDARNMQFMNSSRGKGADVYGKGFANIDAKVKGDMSMLDVNAELTLLGGSNITYIMTDATTALASQNAGDMVRFVQFSDTVDVVRTDTVNTSAMTLNLDALINVSSGTTVNVDLSTDGKNRVQLQGNGTLNYTMNNMDDSRFTGRYNIDNGFVRYTPPLMSEKLFNFQEGSYVAFNGDMLNPILNIRAVDDIRANVTREGQDSRLVNFDVTLSVTNTLSNMNVVFDLSSTDDITIQNELQAMSAEQRANQAMNLLLYNVYTGGTNANANMSGNPLYSFLESQINTWAANNIKFVDISFGIDKYDMTQDGTTSSTMNYSYRVSKTLFNDRFKIVVGGNYSTDTETDEDVAQSLINDISFEYMLNRSGSMYVKIFRHVGYESILEGEVTQTGVGFVYKRKLQTLRDLFRFGRKPKSPQIETDGKIVEKSDEQNK